MLIFHTIATSIALVALLVAVLRHRQHPVPRTLTTGALIACVGQVFPLASVVVGIERINGLLEGHLIGESNFSGFSMDGVEISEDYVVVQQISWLLSQVGLLLVAVGFLLLLRNIIRQQMQVSFQP